ncbi:hypothetical protein COY96_00770 [Candidatus Wolfebacteria bacterium CG_4_10_14_0_8_um_filter_37_11]|uniref:SurA N-terminal domain-containing protein n=2 Tax=Candidatus Wolfeibacteriota TaxID=1752735 RepID=A0A2M7Q854_9BACT|nr:MAG: hypothetical protein COY96_00770 [Candidatus Wolfebacteria bacterium CG_4_10_14_0_8_um_filter_37_11]PJA41784.1 MAG: hypothetical protein CO177_00615 [Candidatus Wolfebacteria bacterium CG_4_9_14_3_um_filter_37_9]
MNNIKKYLLIGLGAVVLIGLSWFIFGGNYPIVFVDFSAISAKDYNKNYLSSLNYYEKALKTYAQDLQVLEADEAKQEIKRAVLDNLIEDILIDRELKKEIKQDDLNVLVEKKINEISESQIADKAIETLYGFSFNEFRQRVLKPQAKKEILENRLFLAGIDFDEKMKDIKAQSRVKIFLSGFGWNGKEVVIK